MSGLINLIGFGARSLLLTGCCIVFASTDCFDRVEMLKGRNSVTITNHLRIPTTTKKKTKSLVHWTMF